MAESIKPYKIISHADIYGKYSKEYENVYALTEEAKSLYRKKYLEQEGEECIFDIDFLCCFISEYDDDKKIDDEILIQIVEELGSKNAFSIGQHKKMLQNEFHLWTMNPKYKEYCFIKTYDDGSRSLFIDISRYKFSKIHAIIKSESDPLKAYEQIASITNEPIEQPTSEWI